MSRDDDQLKITFGQLDALLARLHDIASDKRTQFQARLRNFQRLNIPAGKAIGRGKAVTYGPGDIVQMAIALELTQLGLLPERVQIVFRDDPLPIFSVVGMAAWALIDRPRGFDPRVEDPDNDPWSMFLYFDPVAMSHLMDKLADDEDRASATLFYGGTGIIQDSLVKWTSAPKHRRIALLNVTAMLWHIAELLAPYGEASVFLHAAKAWADEELTAGNFDIDAWIEGPLRKAMNKPTRGDRGRWDGIGVTALVDDLGLSPDVLKHFEAEPDEGAMEALTIHMPGQRKLKVRAFRPLPEKAPSAAEIREMLTALANRTRGQFDDRTDFIILYVPSEPDLWNAMVEDEDLWECGMGHRVLIASPENFAAIARTVEVAWNEATPAQRGEDDEFTQPKERANGDH